MRDTTAEVEAAMIAALSKGPLKLMRLRDAVNMRLHFTFATYTIKTLAGDLVAEGKLTMKNIGNGYLYSLADANQPVQVKE